MNRPLSMLATMLTALLLFGCGSDTATSSQTAEPEVADLRVEEPSTPAPAADVAAVYLRIVNEGAAEDTLTGGTTDVAETVEVHETVTEDGMAEMRPVDGITVPAGGEAVLERGGLHLMLINVEPLQEGDRYTLTLTFERSPAVEVEVPVVAAVPPMSEDPAMGHNGEQDESGMD